ncbi:MAG: alpha/beta hydrolase [Saprospiraceae bacterium]|nr:alpha/beta hydrolase [Saprospiraceae bacterium]
MFDNFEKAIFHLDEVSINYVVGGSGPPLLLLHGYPQTHVMWHKIAPGLAKKFTVVASDLRGYGDSSTPTTTDNHEPYSKRVVANDQVRLMHHLGFESFYLAGHDRGGRVAHRLALDHSSRVRKLVVMDIAPTHTMYTTTDLEFAKAYYHWFFLIQPYDLPERMIGADPGYFLSKKFKQWGGNKEAFTKEALGEYLRCFTPETIHASCEDYRASVSIDLETDRLDIANAHRITCPVLCLWGKKGFVGQRYDVIAEWRKWADNVEGCGFPCGHYLPEEAPTRTFSTLRDFLLHS